MYDKNILLDSNAWITDTIINASTKLLKNKEIHDLQDVVVAQAEDFCYSTLNKFVLILNLTSKAILLIAQVFYHNRTISLCSEIFIFGAWLENGWYT